MAPRFHPRLVNGPFEDPALYIAFAYEKRALLFDLGDLSRLPPRDSLKISHCFVTHTHMDHFCGFDHLLRLNLGREKTLHLYGPEGFLANLEGKLRAYNWNLAHRYRYPFELVASEIVPDGMRTRRFACRDGFRPQYGQDTCKPFEGLVLEEPGLRVEARVLDHGIPCLGFCLVEPIRINIDKAALDRLGLATGAWLKTFKQVLYQKQDPDTLIAAPPVKPHGQERYFRLSELAQAITRLSPGQRIGYITDVAGHAENQKAIVDLTRQADHLFIESAFLARDAHLATAKYHLTAEQAGEIAARAGAKRFTVFHYSPRYGDQAAAVPSEAEQAFERIAHHPSQTIKQNLMHP
jgi:ribonuclease Z